MDGSIDRYWIDWIEMWWINNLLLWAENEEDTGIVANPQQYSSLSILCVLKGHCRAPCSFILVVCAFILVVCAFGF